MTSAICWTAILQILLNITKIKSVSNSRRNASNFIHLLFYQFKIARSVQSRSFLEKISILYNPFEPFNYKNSQLLKKLFMFLCKGSLTLDATCAPAHIRYPQDISLLNEGREFLEGMIGRFCRCYNKEATNNNQVSLAFKINFAEKLKAENSTVSSSRQFNIGYFFLQLLYHDLEIGSFFDTATAGSKITFDPDFVNRFLTCACILHPDSKLNIHVHKKWRKPSKING